jgi:hypothetical protein
MSQTENGQADAPPLVPHVERELPASMRARSGFSFLPKEEFMGVHVELIEEPRVARVRSRDVIEADVADRRPGAVCKLAPTPAVGSRTHPTPRCFGPPIHDHHAALRQAFMASVGPAPDVRIVAVDRDGGAVHGFGPDTGNGPAGAGPFPSCRWTTCCSGDDAGACGDADRSWCCRLRSHEPPGRWP